MKSNSESRSVYTTISIDEYKEEYRPKLTYAINMILSPNPNEFTSVSFEIIYNAIFRCVCSQLSDILVHDLMACTRDYLHQIVNSFKEMQSTEFLPHFADCLIRYSCAVKQLSSLYCYLNRSYFEAETDITCQSLLWTEFKTILVEPYINRIIDSINTVRMIPFLMAPDRMANVVKLIHFVNPEYAKLDYQLFSNYIPNVAPPMNEDDLAIEAQEVERSRKQMKANGFAVQSNKMKRVLEEDDDDTDHKNCFGAKTCV